jgi:hypothetical protein
VASIATDYVYEKADADVRNDNATNDAADTGTVIYSGGQPRER